MSEKFKAGDVVQLRSGGQPMTVRNAYDMEAVLCQWFEGDVLRSNGFPAVCLRREGLMLQGAPAKWHAEDKLEPVAVDHDGEVKSVGELTIGLETPEDVQAIIADVNAKFRQLKLPDQKPPEPVEHTPLKHPIGREFF